MYLLALSLFLIMVIQIFCVNAFVDKTLHLKVFVVVSVSTSSSVPCVDIQLLRYTRTATQCSTRVLYVQQCQLCFSSFGLWVQSEPEPSPNEHSERKHNSML